MQGAASAHQLCLLPQDEVEVHVAVHAIEHVGISGEHQLCRTEQHYWGGKAETGQGAAGGWGRQGHLPALPQQDRAQAMLSLAEVLADSLRRLMMGEIWSQEGRKSPPPKILRSLYGWLCLWEGGCAERNHPLSSQGASHWQF